MRRSNLKRSPINFVCLSVWFYTLLLFIAVAIAKAELRGLSCNAISRVLENCNLSAGNSDLLEEPKHSFSIFASGIVLAWRGPPGKTFPQPHFKLSYFGFRLNPFPNFSHGNEILIPDIKGWNESFHIHQGRKDDWGDLPGWHPMDRDGQPGMKAWFHFHFPKTFTLLQTFLLTNLGSI